MPALLISPYARHGAIDHTTLDATSGLAFIRENWGIEPLTARDASAPSFAGAFDFASPPRVQPVLVSDGAPTTATIRRRRRPPSTPPTGSRS